MTKQIETIANDPHARYNKVAGGYATKLMNQKNAEIEDWIDEYNDVIVDINPTRSKLNNAFQDKLRANLSTNAYDAQNGNWTNVPTTKRIMEFQKLGIIGLFGCFNSRKNRSKLTIVKVSPSGTRNAITMELKFGTTQKTTNCIMGHRSANPIKSSSRLRFCDGNKALFSLLTTKNHLLGYDRPA